MITFEQSVKFNQRWLRLAVLGACDGLGGAEYRRVRKEWEAAGCPALVSLFILHHAAMDSAGNGPLPRLFPAVGEGEAVSSEA